MYEFLGHIPTEELKKLVKSSIKRHSLDLSESTRSELYRILFALYGYDALTNDIVRKLILIHASDEQFDYFKERFDLTNRKRHDNVISLILIRWSYGSKIVKAFKRIFKISPNFLPSKTQSSRKLETISYFKKLNPLFDYQEEVSHKILNFLRSSESTSIVQMPTGSGKTRVALDAVVNELIKNENLSILWLAHSEELLEQTIESLKNIWNQDGNRGLDIGRLWGAVKLEDDLLDVDFLFSGFMKFISIYKNNTDFFEDLQNNFDVVIVDEAHKSVSNTLGKILKEISHDNRKKLIGLTATPGRSVDFNFENKKLVKLYQRIITSEILGDKSISLLQERGILSKIIPVDYIDGISLDFSVSESYQAFENGDITNKILRRLAENSERNKILTNVIKGEFTAKKKTIVFCCNVDHSKKLAVMLAQEGVVSASVDYTIKPNARKRIVDDFKSGKIKVLLNFGIFSTGLDVPDIDTVFITRPTTSLVLYSQMIGRGLRGSKVGGTSECRLINVRDNFKNFGDVDEVYNYFENNWS